MTVRKLFTYSIIKNLIIDIIEWVKETKPYKKKKINAILIVPVFHLVLFVNFGHSLTF